MRSRDLFIAFTTLLISLNLNGQNVPKARSFNPLCDTLSRRLLERTGIKSKLRIQRVSKSGNRLNLQFSKTFSDYPWHIADVKWFRAELEKEWKNQVKVFAPGEISTKNNKFQDLVTPEIGNDGTVPAYNHRIDDPGLNDRNRFINRIGGPSYRKGLQDRYIALWQSHGRYWNEQDSCWHWQRCALHRTIEDMFTQSFVLPFLIPMLENSGAYVMTPRERDIQREEHVIDNDNAFPGPRPDGIRKEGIYSEKGTWTSGGPGFADLKERYQLEDNPFTMGSTRRVECSGTRADASVTWTPSIEKDGDYAVYISYESSDDSCTAAHYKVKHSGGLSEFTVNQTIGGGTWIYLGTFPFKKGDEAGVTLDNRGPGDRHVSADAVRFGGGMGKIERGGTLSGMPSYAEGALYSMKWAGVDTTVTHNWDKEYTKDFAARGAWTQMMKDEKGIPFDLSLAFHSDAGLTPNDSTIGTLAIYSYIWDGDKKFKDGRSRMTSRLFAEYVQDQVVSDIRSNFEPEWNRRELWDRSYSESRTSSVPGMILELLSHQNFADMKLGLDPAFRFNASRSVYKGILKTLSAFYGCQYVVQPLPVHCMSLTFADSGNALLSWEPTEDPLEPTAKTDSYILYTRKDDGCFNEGVSIKGNNVEIPIEDDHIYSFKICAVNEGGKSFPSEILSIGRPGRNTGEILIVNNFDRISAPMWIDGPEYAGFEGGLDSGVPYVNDISYVGENYEFRRDIEYENDENPGFGASLSDKAGSIVAGNTFDYPFIHGKALFEIGYSFCSVSREAFCKDREWKAEILDLICGKQKTTTIGSGAVPARFRVFPEDLKKALKDWCGNGKNILISGANIASDEKTSGFTEDFFGYKSLPGVGTASGKIGSMLFHHRPNPVSYCVESPDGLEPASKKARILLTFPVSNIPAAVVYSPKEYKTVSIGVPIETIISESDRIELVRMSLQALQTN